MGPSCADGTPSPVAAGGCDVVGGPVRWGAARRVMPSAPCGVLCGTADHRRSLRYGGTLGPNPDRDAVPAVRRVPRDTPRTGTELMPLEMAVKCAFEFRKPAFRAGRSSASHGAACSTVEMARTRTFGSGRAGIRTHRPAHLPADPRPFVFNWMCPTFATASRRAGCRVGVPRHAAPGAATSTPEGAAPRNPVHFEAGEMTWTVHALQPGRAAPWKRSSWTGCAARSSWRHPNHLRAARAARGWRFTSRRFLAGGGGLPASEPCDRARSDGRTTKGCRRRFGNSSIPISRKRSCNSRLNWEDAGNSLRITDRSGAGHPNISPDPQSRTRRRIE